jgi:glycosyltransferase involved in cell wall biosynthesis
MANPLITTIIPTFRRPLLLRRAIISVLSQTLCDLRVCVYDNASNDETETTVRSLQSIDSRIDYYRHPLDIGAINNFNFGLGKVESKYFSFLSDDDFLLPDFYKLATPALEAHPAAAFVSTEVLLVDKAMRLLGRSNERWKPGYYLAPAGLMAMCGANNHPPIWTGILFRREVLDAVGILDAEVGGAADHDYVRRIAAKFPFVVVPSVGAVFVHHLESASHCLTLSGIWPGTRKTMQNLLLDESLPLPLRRCLRSALEYEMSHIVFGFGWTALIQARGENAAALRRFSDVSSGCGGTRGFSRSGPAWRKSHRCYEVSSRGPLAALARFQANLAPDQPWAPAEYETEGGSFILRASRVIEIGVPEWQQLLTRNIGRASTGVWRVRHSPSAWKPLGFVVRGAAERQTTL